MMQVSKKIHFEDPDVLNTCRAIYIGSNLIIFSLYLYIKTVIDKKKGAWFPDLACCSIRTN